MVDEVTRRVPPAGPQPVRPAGPARPGAAGAAGGFAEVLRERLAGTGRAAGVQFSRHALERLQASGRPMSPAQVRAVEEAIDRAAAKGARESLILVDDLALVVSVPNRTVITAVAGERMKEQVFTHIDSAVIVRER